jgi:molybdenum cofactor synthesis domain-containing protein
MSAHAAIIVVSDSRSSGHNTDLAGPRLQQLLLDQGWACGDPIIVPDEQAAIERSIRDAVEGMSRGIVVTTGGTGVGPRDVTPEATRNVVDREVPGLAELMRSKGAETTSFSWLSRGIVGQCGGVFVVNTPGKPAAACESLESVIELIAHALHVAGGGGHPDGVVGESSGPA